MSTMVKKKIAKKSNKSSALREAEKILADYGVVMKKRGDWARKILKAQDETTRRAVYEMVEVISSMADTTGEGTVTLKNGETMRLKAPKEFFEDGWLWVAIRLLVAAHDWDIRVANFKPIRKAGKNV